MADLIRMHLTAIALTVAIWVVLFAALGLTVLRDVGETASSWAGLGIAVTGLLGGYGIALWRLARKYRKGGRA